MPDKAIDLVDQACATIRTEMGSNPTELDQVNRRVMQLEIEESALKNESDNASKHRLEELQEELSNEKEKQSSLKSRVEQEKEKIAPIKRDTACFSIYSLISILIICFSESKSDEASDFANSVLPTPVGPKNKKLPIGLFGSLIPARALTTASDTKSTALS